MSHKMQKHSGNSMQYCFTLKFQGIFREKQNKKFSFLEIAIYVHIQDDISHYHHVYSNTGPDIAIY